VTESPTLNYLCSYAFEGGGGRGLSFKYGNVELLSHEDQRCAHTQKCSSHISSLILQCKWYAAFATLCMSVPWYSYSAHIMFPKGNLVVPLLKSVTHGQQFLWILQQAGWGVWRRKRKQIRMFGIFVWTCAGDLYSEDTGLSINLLEPPGVSAKMKPQLSTKPVNLSVYKCCILQELSNCCWNKHTCVTPWNLISAYIVLHSVL
jgi:hypothetical protein